MKTIVDYAEKDNAEAIINLLSSGQNINLFEYGRSALHAACVSNAITSAELLIKRGIDVNLRDEHTGATALHYCATYNYFEMAKMILQNHGRLDIADNYGNEPLWTSVFNVKGNIDKIPIVDLFLKHGADKYHKNNVSKCPFDFTERVKFQPLLELLNK